ncbi:hypothetical protein Y1Q_0009395 [Alligator mississippiensis]|uniref:Uncharacterized protein n=1 Tax=Alligator mississippiensis TaxID=8496 RepID=A0A151N7L0_ALLMI|nr:hypothetical protein Y1Q_0009395 [Alligator mississippiensis]
MVCGRRETQIYLYYYFQNAGARDRVQKTRSREQAAVGLLLTDFLCLQPAVIRSPGSLITISLRSKKLSEDLKKKRKSKHPISNEDVCCGKMYDKGTANQGHLFKVLSIGSLQNKEGQTCTVKVLR